MIYNFSIPPNGFKLEYTVEGYPFIRYRAREMQGSMIPLIIWLVLWTFGCIFFTNHAFTEQGVLKFGLLLFISLFWAAEFCVIGYLIWYFASIMSYEFQPDKIIVSRTCLMYKKQRELIQAKIKGKQEVLDMMRASATA